MPKFCPALACIFVVIVLLTAAPAAAQEVWSATLTVAEFEFTTDRGNDRRLLGYKAEHGDASPGFTDASFGELSDVDFMLDGVSHTITGVYTEDHEPTQQGALIIHLEPPVSGEGLSFTIDGEVFAISDVLYHGPATCCPGDTISWLTDVFGWTGGQQVSVSLSGPESVPVLPVPALGLLLALLSAAGIAARRLRPRPGPQGGARGRYGHGGHR